MLDEPTAGTAAATEKGRGREAEQPTEIPPAGWKDVFKRAWAHTGEDNISLAAGGVTYYVLVALFPGLAALVSIYGLFSDPLQVQQQVAALSGVLPAQAQSLIASELKQITSSSGGALSFGAVIGFLIALYSASRGVGGLMIGLNIAYEEKERRSLFWQYLIALILTGVLIVAGLVAIGFIAGAPAVINAIGLGDVGTWLIYILEWPVLMAFMLVILAIIYRYGPSRDHPKWAWISPGALTATVLWLIGSIIFTVYVSHFGNYNKTYGSLGAIIVLLTWMYLSAYVVLFGAEINAQAERQTQRDTTVGEPKPMGQRDATAADTLGRSTS
jgi:membrane protein